MVRVHQRFQVLQTTGTYTNTIEFPTATLFAVTHGVLSIERQGAVISMFDSGEWSWAEVVEVVNA